MADARWIEHGPLFARPRVVPENQTVRGAIRAELAWQ